MKLENCHYNGCPYHLKIQLLFLEYNLWRPKKTDKKTMADATNPELQILIMKVIFIYQLINILIMEMYPLHENITKTTPTMISSSLENYYHVTSPVFKDL